MRKNKLKAMSLVETITAMCIASMLLLGLGTSFYMFRVVNTDTITNTKEELNILSVRDYINTNSEAIIKDQIDGTYYLVFEDNLASSYDVYDYDKNYYLVKSGDSFPRGSLVQGMSGIDIRIIKDGEQLKTLSGQSVVRIKTPEFYKESMRFILIGHDDKGNEKNKILNTFNDYSKTYYDELGESIYYSDLFENEDIFADVFRYENGTLYIKTKDGKEKEALKNLPYESLNVSFKIESKDYHILDETGETVPTYGVIADVNDPQYGVSYVYSSNHSAGVVSLVAKESSVFGEDILNKYKEDKKKKEEEEDEEIDHDHEDEDEEDDGEDPIYEELKERYEKGILYSYKFKGWKVEGEGDYVHDQYFQRNDIDVAIPEDGTKKVCTAVFEDELTECEGVPDSTIYETYKYTITDKELYIITCKIDYSEINEEEVLEEKTSEFVIGVYNKYFPEVYQKEN